MTETELVRAAQKGDESAFEELVRTYEKKIYHLSLRMCNNQEDALEIAQETFLSAWRGLRFFRGDSSFSTWLYRLASNAAIDFLRREGRQSALSGLSLDDESLRLDPPDSPAASPTPIWSARSCARRWRWASWLSRRSTGRSCCCGSCRG